MPLIYLYYCIGPWNRSNQQGGIEKGVLHEQKVLLGVHKPKIGGEIPEILQVWLFVHMYNNGPLRRSNTLLLEIACFLFVFVLCLAVLFLARVKSERSLLLPIAAGLALAGSLLLTLIFIFRRFIMDRGERKRDSSSPSKKSRQPRHHRLARLLLVLAVFTACAYTVFLHFFIGQKETRILEGKALQFTSMAADGSHNCTFYCDPVVKRVLFVKTTNNDEKRYWADRECQEVEGALMARLLRIQPEVINQSFHRIHRNTFLYSKQQITIFFNPLN